ncbi:MAG: 3-hydroxyacyl-CoA dehydrogenase, partial [Geminicoccaceae bacterium]|nr:3-hydroxyacyl-CoA dehydrogenase [Geminicoccaceae bacterium]
MDMPVERVAVVGCGTIGTGWAIFFRARGLEVRVWDPAADHADRIERAVEDGEADLRTLGLMAQPPGRIVFCARAEEAVEGASFVQESAPEQLELKRTLYRRIAPALPPDALLASSTSFLQPSALQEDLPFAERLVVGHPFNPPHLIPLVEVMGNDHTAQQAVTGAEDFYRLTGKVTIRVRREVPGHVANRLQAALWREAIHLVKTGVASVEDVD